MESEIQYRRFGTWLLSMLLTAVVHSSAFAQEKLTCLELFERQSRLGSEVQSQTFNLKTLRSKVFAVHATDHFPENGVVKAGGAINPVFRPELHFALGMLVKAHSMGNWEKKPFAVLAPLKALEPQLLNLMVHDTFILGDFHLTPGSIVVLPEGDTHVVPVGIKAFYYNKSLTLREAVAKAISENGGLNFVAMSESAGINDSAYLLTDPSRKNLNSPEVFAPILAQHPSVSFAEHAGTRWGYIDHFLTWTVGVVKKNWGFNSSTETIVFQRTVVEMHLKALDHAVLDSTYPAVSKNSYLEAKAKIRKYLNIIDADLFIRKQYGKTAFVHPGPFIEDLFSLSHDVEGMKAYLIKNLDRLDVERPPSDDRFSFFLYELLLPQTLSPAELQELAQKFPREFNKDGTYKMQPVKM